MERFFTEFCNPRTGRWWWILVEAFGAIIVCGWVFFALPWVGTCIGLSFLGSSNYEEITAYNGLFSIARANADLYFFCVFVATALAKGGWGTMQLGRNCRQGYVYLTARECGVNWGNWYKLPR